MTNYPITVSTAQAQVLALQVCAPNPYANLEALTYTQLETFIYGQLELQCRNIYGRAVTAQQPTAPALIKQSALARTLTQSQSVALRRAVSLRRVLSASQSLTLSTSRVVLRTLAIQQATAVSLSRRAVQALTLATMQATGVRLVQVIGLRRAITQPEQVTLQVAAGVTYRLTVSTSQTQHVTLNIAAGGIQPARTFSTCHERPLRFASALRRTSFAGRTRDVVLVAGPRRPAFAVQSRVTVFTARWR
jgi:hypothetical protein